MNEIRFAARHGFLTKPLWREFFAKGSLNWQNKRWNYFRTSGLFRGSNEHADLLLPNAGHPIVKELAEVISRPPRLEQLGHDKVIAKTDLEVARKFPSCTVVVEAEAKRREVLTNGSIHNFEADKYPDLTVFKDGLLVAIEIETSLKSKERYDGIFDNYGDAELDYLIYVVSTREMKTVIQTVADEVLNGDVMLGFSSLKEWTENALTATVQFPDRLSKLANLLK